MKMMTFNKLHPASYSIRHAYSVASCIRVRYFSESDDNIPPKTSAAAQLAKAMVRNTIQEPPRSVQRPVQVEHVRSKISELDQRKLRHHEYTEMLKQLVLKPGKYALEKKLPFKQPSAANNTRQSIRACTSVEEVLQITDDPNQLAHELVKLSWELNTQKRKHDVVLENYLDLKQQMLLKKD